LITVAHQQSQNLYAEVLLRWLGQRSVQQASGSQNLSIWPDLTEQGTQVIEQTVTQWGIDAMDLQVADGSGLSRHNLVTPAALVQVLRHSAQQSWGEVYRRSLPVAGESGTLAHRFEHTLLAGKLWAKTGSMRGIAALSGYWQLHRSEDLNSSSKNSKKHLNSSTQDLVVFSVLINHSSASAGALARSIDDLFLQLAGVSTCQYSPPSGNRHF
jgi:D-alanyl-D-alanine carboxypeptidase/D-alanyl-D-alanine-endopeptidase (penicillin-binding protein 4)